METKTDSAKTETTKTHNLTDLERQFLSAIPEAYRKPLFIELKNYERTNFNVKWTLFEMSKARRAWMDAVVMMAQLLVEENVDTVGKNEASV